MIRTLGVLAVIIMPLSCVAQSTDSSGQQALKPGTPYYEFEQTTARFILNGNRVAASTGYRRVLALDPNFAPAWFNLGYIAELEKDWQEAKRDYSKYIELSPKTQDAERARNELAVIERMSSPGYEKEASYAASIQKARVFLKGGLYKEAIAEAARAERIDGNRWESYAVVSLCMAKQNKLQEAQQFASLAVDHASAEKREQVRAAISVRSIDPAQSATLHIFRNSSTGGALHPLIHIDQQKTIEILNRQNVRMLVPPGKHTVSVGDKDVANSEIQDLVMDAGKDYWIKLSLSIGISKAHSKLSLEAPEIGRSESSKLDEINFGDALKKDAQMQNSTRAGSSPF